VSPVSKAAPATGVAAAAAAPQTPPQSDAHRSTKEAASPSAAAAQPASVAAGPITVHLSLAAVDPADDSTAAATGAVKVALPINGSRVLVGRDASLHNSHDTQPDLYAEVPCPFLSQEHLAMWVEGDHETGDAGTAAVAPANTAPMVVMVEDLRSSNGSTLNGRRLRGGVAARLFAGDVLRLAGRVACTVDCVSPQLAVATRQAFLAQEAARKHQHQHQQDQAQQQQPRERRRRKATSAAATSAGAAGQGITTRAAARSTGLLSLSWRKDLSSTSPVNSTLPPWSARLRERAVSLTAAATTAPAQTNSVKSRGRRGGHGGDSGTENNPSKKKTAADKLAEKQWQAVGRKEARRQAALRKRLRAGDLVWVRMNSAGREEGGRERDATRQTRQTKSRESE
jgi:hypothetical protein